MSVCLSVCLSVTRLCSVETAERILGRFSPSGSQTILVIPHQTLRQYSHEDSYNGDVETRKQGYEKIADFRPVSNFQ